MDWGTYYIPVIHMFHNFHDSPETIVYVFLDVQQVVFPNSVGVA